MRDVSLEIGKKIRARRKYLGLSLENLANALNCSVQTVNKYEKAVIRVPSPVLFEISRALKTSLNYFFEDLVYELEKEVKEIATTTDLKGIELNVLIVEDNLADELVIKRAMDTLESKVNAFILRDADQFINFLNDRIENVPFKKPDLILMDIRLQSNSGIELLKIVKQSSQMKNIPIIMFTNLSDINTLRQCYVNGACGFINKSFDSQETIDTLHKTIDYWTNCVILPKSNDARKKV